MNTLPLRVLTALTTILVLVILTYFLQNNGIRLAIVLATLAAIRETARIFFNGPDEYWEKILFVISALAVFVLSSLVTTHLEVIYSFVATFSCSLLLFRYRKNENINRSLLSILKLIVGVFYVGLLPAFTYLILNLKHSLAWFATLILVISAGDTFAFISGQLWGNEKIAPALSPKKTVAGAIGGAIGSVIAGLLSMLFLHDVPWYVLIIMSLTAGFIGQMGDFFESLLKRTAGIKDSGSLMPGHGGILDRVDGVLFAAPVIYFVAALFQ